MLQDPEAQADEWSQEVFAKDMDEAKRKCQNITNSTPLTDVINVTQKTKTPNSQGGYTFICWFKSEVSGDKSDGHDF